MLIFSQIFKGLSLQYKCMYPHIGQVPGQNEGGAGWGWGYPNPDQVTGQDGGQEGKGTPLAGQSMDRLHCGWFPARGLVALLI